MGYVEKNLMSGEEVVYRAKVHWMIYLMGLFFIVLGITIIASAKEIALLGVLLVIGGLIDLFKAFIFKMSTELVVTTKRVIAKFGFIKRTTMELNHSKVESLSVDQGIIQRILNAGTITVHGTGGGKTPIPNIDEPLIFRTNAMETIDKN
ncbi:PH domain-containing protein [Sulfurovum sp.]|uniref:PH domain-containing protein n=1 Tax=Sulfurovum sp. TaxID=1969726 RepID=UPI002A3663C0|nr:PH domain-containing protein [Sulfurovum sp.]MDD3500525.1 PH domain-containing protein [Sulfurovum sp.]MDY0402289.1 PH domain-containing protein [Sulfurovum sp.]